MRNYKKQVYNYTAVFEEDPRGGYSVWVPDLPGCASQGENLEEAKGNITEAIQLYLDKAPGDYTKPEYMAMSQFIMPIRVSVPSYGKDS